MTKTLPSTTHPQSRRKHDTSTFEARLKAAGLHREGDRPDYTQDIDEFRREFARAIEMFINDWEGCREPLCRRHHGCMAPNNECSNLAPVTEEEMERDWPKVQAEVYKTMKAHLTALGLQDE
jgi:hypothetical protein